MQVLPNLSYITFAGSGQLNRLLAIETRFPFSKTIYAEGTTDGGASAMLPAKLVVCGNEIVTTKSDIPIKIIRNKNP